MVPDWVQYNPETEVLTIDGIQFSRDFFQFLCRDEIGTVGRIEKRDRGMVMVTRVPPNQETK